MASTQNSRTSGDAGLDAERPLAATKEFEQRHEGKPIKAAIGVGLLVVLALILSHMHPVPHEIAADPSTMGQITTEHAR